MAMHKTHPLENDNVPASQKGFGFEKHSNNISFISWVQQPFEDFKQSRKRVMRGTHGAV